MITKPIYLYPDSMSISPEDNILTLTACYPTSCSLERFIGKDGLEYCYGTLFIMNEFGEYRIHSSNPISGHALVKYDQELANCEVGTTYKITCNFIDSDEAYFEMYSTPKISIIENICNISFTDKNGSLIRATENNPYVMDYCNLDISLTINQKEGVESDSFNYRIYRKDSIGNYEEMFFSSNIYSSDLRVRYDDLLDNSEYKIAISIFYSNNISTTTDLYFNTKLIGMIDCYSSGRGLIDTYDILTSWNNFSTSANLKCLIDSRGLILPGNFEQNPSVEYKKCSAAYASVKFNYRQKSDLDIIQVYATILPFNPLHNNLLQSSDDYILTSKDNMLLLSTR